MHRAESYLRTEDVYHSILWGTVEVKHIVQFQSILQLVHSLESKNCAGKCPKRVDQTKAQDYSHNQIYCGSLCPEDTEEIEVAG